MRIGSKRPHDPRAGERRWVRWRAGRLVVAGFPADLAEQLAGRERVDLHELLELVDRGCPPRLAVRILAPLDSDPERW